jgi:phage/plasmid primase-like uncharacterized protein
VWSFGDWRLGIKERGEGDPGRILTPQEIADRKQRLHDLRIRVAAEEAEFQAGAAILAHERWDRCPPAPPNHPYLKSKGIKPCGTRIDGDKLLVPMRDIDGKIWSIQEIAPDGFKNNQEGGRRKGCFFQVGEISDIFCIEEGFSTGATLHIATGCAAISAGDAGNLEIVAKAMRAKHPTATIIVAADDDWVTRIKGKPHNTGKIAAQKAAKAIGGVLALPWFHPSSRPKWATDFNDMARLYGLDEVATCIRLAVIKHTEISQAKDQQQHESGAVTRCSASTSNRLAPTNSRSAMHRLYGLLRSVALATEGARKKLFWATCRVRDMLAAGELDQEMGVQAVDALHKAAARAALPTTEISRTINSALKGASRSV